MIQDRTMQDLWAAVEELRQKVEQLENGGPPPATSMSVPQFDYVARSNSQHSTRQKPFHVRSCRYAAELLAKGVNCYEFETPEDAIEAGFVPCKICAA